MRREKILIIKQALEEIGSTDAGKLLVTYLRQIAFPTSFSTNRDAPTMAFIEGERALAFTLLTNGLDPSLSVQERI